MPARRLRIGRTRDRRIGDSAGQSVFVDRFGWLLVLVLATIVSFSLIDTHGSLIAGGITHAFSGAALMLAVRAAGLDWWWRRAADVLVVATLGFNAFLVLLDVLPSDVVEIDRDIQPELYWLAAAALVPVVVSRRLLTHRVVTAESIMGAVSAYLQIAVAYALAFQVIGALTREEFFGTDVPTTAYMYVSLETITTLGYGDLVPKGELARLVTVSEAVIGQVFLVTFVALIVSRFAGGTAAGPPEDRRDEGPMSQREDGGS